MIRTMRKGQSVSAQWHGREPLSRPTTAVEYPVPGGQSGYRESSGQGHTPCTRPLGTTLDGRLAIPSTPPDWPPWMAKGSDAVRG